MNDTMKYKGYEAVIETDVESREFHGRVIGLRGGITFVADNFDNLEKEFHQSVDIYLEVCAEKGIEPEKPYAGKFLLRMSPDLHRKVDLEARKVGASLNSWLVQMISTAVDVQREAGFARQAISFAAVASPTQRSAPKRGASPRPLTPSPQTPSSPHPRSG